jgi:Ca-activated chloride channel family protein
MGRLLACEQTFRIMPLLAGILCCCALPRAYSQNSDTLNQVHVEPPPASALPAAKADAKAAGAAPAGPNGAPVIHVESDLTLIPVEVTDPLGRIVTGLDKENFYLLEKAGSGQFVAQTIRTFSTDDAPVSLGIILDLSGSMTDKFNRARQSVRAFMQTSNPEDEFFVIGFNDRPELIEDFTTSSDDVDARLAMVHPGKRTALLDAVYFGITKMRDAKYGRKALLIVSDGGDNRSRYTEGELRNTVRESDVQIYSIGIFDQYAPTTEEEYGPLLLNDLCEDTGGRLFRVDDLSQMSDVAAKISDAIREEYILGYRSTDTKRDGKWRKVKVQLEPPPGLPPLTVHARNGYYAPVQ